MNIEIAIVSAAAILLTASAAIVYKRRKKLAELRELLEFAQNQIDELQDAMLGWRACNDAAAQRATDQARRIAWLETRLRKPRASSNEVLDDSIITETPKLSMTERRHRVISLADRGKGVDSIAASLGIFKGEVELILSLNQAAIGAR